MKTRMRILVSGLWLALGLPGAGLGEELETARSGPYLGVAVGGAIPVFDGQHFFGQPVNLASVQNKDTLALNARLGWRLLPFLAAEVQYEWTDEFRMRTLGATCAKVRGQIVTGNLKLIAPLDTVQPYLLAGVGAGHYDLDISEIQTSAFTSCAIQNGYGPSQKKWEMAGRFGGGFDFYITRGILMNFEAASVYSDDKFLGKRWPYVTLTAGIQYRF